MPVRNTFTKNAKTIALSWASEEDPKAVQQVYNMAELDFISGHIAMMPDMHYGRGACVGSVIPTVGAIIPAAVGVDLGCGMIATKLKLNASQLPDDLRKLHTAITKAVPAGVGKGHEVGEGENSSAVKKHMPDFPSTTDTWGKDWQKKALTQFGSLGSGNHFVEICLDEGDQVWVVLHSGSRGIGNVIAQKHIADAKNTMKDYGVKLTDPDLSYIPETVKGEKNPAFQHYITEMLWSQDYALGNREAMMDAVLVEIATFLGYWPGSTDRINCHHNFTAIEHHHGKNMWITRKGAIRAREGDRGIIPGSMGTRSYIVSGTGSEASYQSCAHGAGRRMSRTKAKKELSLNSLNKAMEGITWNGGPGTRAGNDKMLLDEHPQAYKDIDVVMEDQSDLVTVQHELRQILNYKGS